MQLTPRRRAALAIILSWPLGFLYMYWALYVALDIARWYRGGFVRCDGSWRSYTNSCSNYNVTLAWAELLVVSALALAVAALIARWVVQPVRDLAAMVHSFGPNSLGLRLGARGPRDETRLLSDEIDAMLARLAEGYEAQRRFAANASHELRTPLATQRALIEVSLSSPLTSEQLELLSRQLLATNERNERLVDGLLALAETERGLLAHVPLRLDAVVAEAAGLWREPTQRRGVELRLTLAPTTVSGEAPLLERLVNNLLDNAVKYNVEGGWVEATVDPAGILTVANTGPDVPPEQVTALFEPFRRLSGERLDHGGGVGLGLTIARSIVAAHGGQIDARPRPGGGLIVEVRLPAARPWDDASADDVPVSG
jgi:signal transduction histidine kinase